MKRCFAALLLIMIATAGVGAVELGEDGLHKQTWFALTFRDIAEDIESARADGKRLALMLEQRGCTYCKEIHEKVLTEPKIREFVESNFMMVQYNIYGDEEVIDTDGEQLTEKTAARKWGVLFTPTIIFLPDTPPENKSAMQAAVAVMPGAFHTGTFIDMFTWVNEKGYEGEEDFQRYHARRIRERTEAGEVNTD